MGLDVVHIQLSKEIIEDDDFLNIEDWGIDCNVSIENYSEYITNIEDTEIDKNILIIKKAEDYARIIEEGYILEDKIIDVFIGNKFKWDWESIVKKYFVDNNIENWSNTIITIGSKDLEFMTASTIKTVTVKGMYYSEVGHQRNGMNEIFHNDFTEFFLWGNKRDFLKAYECLDDSRYCDRDENTLKEMQEYFKDRFINSFIFGKSLLMVSF